jgi:hypothetical protein
MGFESFEGTYRDKDEGGRLLRNVGIKKNYTDSSNPEKNESSSRLAYQFESDHV